MPYNILIWGIGARVEKYLKFDYFKKTKIIGFIDTYKSGTTFKNYRVYNTSALPELMEKVDYLIVGTQYFSEVYEYCLEYKIDRYKIIFTDYIMEPFIYQNMEVIRSISEKLWEDILMRNFRFICMNEKDNYDENRLIGNGNYSDTNYMKDYFRYRTFEFLAEEIIQKDIKGCVAELGVFQGRFSALINEKFSSRDLYLFDTFEGFDKKEAEQEERKGRSNDEFVYAHKQTSEKMVLEKLPFPQRCHIYKGLFPYTVTNELEKLEFAFVSIDVDFEESIYQGIRFFYPRLVDNGIIFLHDYNSLNLSGVKLAVQRFEAETESYLKKVPLADRAGTLVIIK